MMTKKCPTQVVNSRFDQSDCYPAETNQQQTLGSMQNPRGLGTLTDSPLSSAAAFVPGIGTSRVHF